MVSVGDQYQTCSSGGCHCLVYKPELFCFKHKPNSFETIRNNKELRQCAFVDHQSRRCTALTSQQENEKYLCADHRTPQNLILPGDLEDAEDIDYRLHRKRNEEQPYILDSKGAKIPVEDVHFRFKLAGPQGRQMLFHAMLRAADTDYPLDPDRKRSKPLMRCGKCNGYFWKSACPEIEDIRRAAKQAGLKKIKFSKWVSARKCGGQTTLVPETSTGVTV